MFIIFIKHKQKTMINFNKKEKKVNVSEKYVNKILWTCSKSIILTYDTFTPEVTRWLSSYIVGLLNDCVSTREFILVEILYPSFVNVQHLLRKQFMNWFLVSIFSKRCSNKSYYKTETALKNFHAYIHTSQRHKAWRTVRIKLIKKVIVCEVKPVACRRWGVAEGAMVPSTHIGRTPNQRAK